jgi:hypothetical protein
MKRLIKSIIRSMTKRDESFADSMTAHEQWIRSPAGALEAAALAEACLGLDPEVRDFAAEIAARTGASAAVPLVAAALKDPDCGRLVLTGVWYAARFGSDPEFKKGVAPHLIPWTLRQTESGENHAITALPEFDPDLARSALLQPEFLDRDDATAVQIIKAFTEAGLAVPLDVVRCQLERWEPKLKASRGGGADFLAWKTCICALAFHHPEDAVIKVQSVVTKWPGCSDSLSEVLLHAAGITGIYYRLCDFADDAARFETLPHPARLYFAASYFLSDWENGGVGQALSNSTGDYAHLAKQGFAAAGDTWTCSYLDKVFALFGSEGPPLNREARQQLMDTMQPTFWDQEESLNDEWHAALKKRRSEVSSRYLLDRYAAKHAEVLQPLMRRHGA